MATVLDHGYVTLIEHWGSDERIIEAARMSTNKGFLGWGPVHEDSCALMQPPKTEHVAPSPMHPHGGARLLPGETPWFQVKCTCTPKAGDEKLLRYLWEHKHYTPFEMGGLTVEVQAPIFVFREWHRHRTQSYNELSARYTPLPDVNYVPTLERVMLKGGANKQATGLGHELTEFHAKAFILNLTKSYTEAEAQYQMALADGVPKELARLVLPVGRYSRMRASANLRNWFAFLTLRLDPAAQWEIRQYAMAVAELVEGAFPRSFALFRKD